MKINLVILCFIFSCLFVSSSLENYSGIFFENFESGTFTNNSWYTYGGSTTNWTPSTATPISGTYSAIASNTDAETVLVNNISTVGYGNIRFSFYYGTVGLDAGEYLRADYYNGTNWINILDVTATNVGSLLGNYSLPASTENRSNFGIRFRCSVDAANENCKVDNVTIQGTQLLDANLVDIYILDQNYLRINVLNNTAVEESNLLVLNFSLNHLYNISSWYLNYSANGTNACSLGNKQSSTCYSYPNWIQFINGTETSTFDGVKESQSDFIHSYSSKSGNISNYSFIIDEHYNPNVFKWYEANYNFSDFKWQNETEFRLTGNNLLKFELNSSLIPINMDLARVDLRVAYVGTPEKLIMFGCNSSYFNQNPYTYSGCQLVGEKNYNELVENGTKFKTFFSKTLIDSIGDLSYLILHSPGSNQSEYYYIKTYKANAENYTIHWNYSNDLGLTWNTSNESYESQININWFYGGNEPTSFVYRFFANTTRGDETYLEGNLTWDINEVNNYPPLVVIGHGDGLHYFSLPYEMPFLVYDTNGDLLNVSGYLYKNGTLNQTIFTDENSFISSYLCSGPVEDGFYTFIVEACELNTTDLYCRNSTREVGIDNNFPIVQNLLPVENNEYYDNTTNIIEISANVTDLNVSSVVANISYPNGTIYELNLSNSFDEKYNASFEIPLIAGRFNVTIIATDYLENVNNTESTYFILNDVTSPKVNLEYPFQNNISNSDSIEISASILDSSEIDSIITKIDYPNGTTINISNFSMSIESDSFNENNLLDKWGFRNDSVASGQTCYSDINGTYEGKLYLEINGSATESGTLCGISSLDKLDGDYDIYIDFDIVSMESDTIFVFRVNSLNELYSFGNRLFISLRQVNGQKYYRFGFLNGTELNITQIPTNDTYGKFRIKRYNSSNNNYQYDAFYWNNLVNEWVKILDGVSVTNSTRTQYVQIFLESLEINFGEIKMIINEFVSSTEKSYFSLFEPPILEGRYNVSLFVNDTLGNSNNTENTFFNLFIINTAPPNPIIYRPSINNFVKNMTPITWSLVKDKEGDKLKYNISLLNNDSSFNSTIVSNYGASSSTSYSWNTTNYSDGRYKIRIVVYENETLERYSSNSSPFIGTFFIDNTIPQINFLDGTTSSGTYSSLKKIDFNINSSDTNFDNVTVNLYSLNGLIDSYSSDTNSFNGSFFLSSSGTYYLNATVYDLAQNKNYTETKIIVIGSQTSGSSESSSSSPGFSFFDESILSLGVTKNLYKNQGFGFYFNNEKHFLKIIDCANDYSVIQVQSDFFEKKMKVGEIWKIDFDKDIFYDLSIKLNSIDSQNRSNITIQKINESYKKYPVFEEMIVEEDTNFFKFTGKTISNLFTKSGHYIGIYVLLFLGVLYLIIRTINYRRKMKYYGF